MYEIWSLGHKPFGAFPNNEVRMLNISKKLFFLIRINIIK